MFPKCRRPACMILLSIRIILRVNENREIENTPWFTFVNCIFLLLFSSFSNVFLIFWLYVYCMSKKSILCSNLLYKMGQDFLTYIKDMDIVSLNSLWFRLKRKWNSFFNSLKYAKKITHFLSLLVSTNPCVIWVYWVYSVDF